MVLVCPCAALTEGLVSLYIVCMCVNCLNIYYINLIVSFLFLYYILAFSYSRSGYRINTRILCIYYLEHIRK